MQVLIELDAETVRRLEAVAPARSRKRSMFIRAAIEKSLCEVEEAKTRRAYIEQPDIEPPVFDPDSWAPAPYGGFDPPTRSPKRAPTRGGARRPKKRSSR